MNESKRTPAALAVLLGAGAASQVGVEAAGNSNHVRTENPKDSSLATHIPRARSMTAAEREAVDNERVNADIRNSATHLTDPDTGGADGLGRPAVGTGTLAGTSAPGATPATLGSGATAGGTGSTGGGTAGSGTGSGSSGGSNR